MFDQWLRSFLKAARKTAQKPATKPPPAPCVCFSFVFLGLDTFNVDAVTIQTGFVKTNHVVCARGHRFWGGWGGDRYHSIRDPTSQYILLRQWTTSPQRSRVIIHLTQLSHNSVICNEK